MNPGEWAEEGSQAPRLATTAGLASICLGEALDVVSPRSPISFLHRFPVSLAAPKSEPRSLWAAPEGGQALRPGKSELSQEGAMYLRDHGVSPAR